MVYFFSAKLFLFDLKVVFILKFFCFYILKSINGHILKSHNVLCVVL